MSSRTTKGNIFRDLGQPKDVAENLVIRSQLMRALQSVIKEKSITQEQAAEWLGVEQPRISNLMTGRIDVFSIDALVNMAVLAGLSVSLSIRRTFVHAQAKSEFRPTKQQANEELEEFQIFISRALKKFDLDTFLAAKSANDNPVETLSTTTVDLLGKVHAKSEVFTQRQKV